MKCVGDDKKLWMGLRLFVVLRSHKIAVYLSELTEGSNALTFWICILQLDCRF